MFSSGRPPLPNSELALQRASRILRGLIQPHPSVTGQMLRRRAQLLAALSLLLCALTILGGLLSSSFGIFLLMAALSLITYYLSRTRYHVLGTYLFSYSFAAIAYVRVYSGAASSIDSAVTSTGHVALILASALLPQAGFAVLATLSTVAAFTSPLYSHVPPNAVDSVARTGGIVLTLSALLYGVNLFLSTVDRARLDELQNANRESEDARKNLEQHVVERTLELQQLNDRAARRAARLQAIAEISQAITTRANQDLAQLFTFITTAISEQTGFYHVGIFMLDENREYAVLQAANSAGGKRMLERRHQLKVGGTGLVGYVSQGGRPRIALDTGADAVFFNNPDLPQTRSEMALPLKVGTQILGALDVQSDQPSAFTDEDVTAVSALANQIAIIIQNTQLTGQSESTTGARSLRRGLSLGRSESVPGFTYSPDGTLSTTARAQSEVATQALASGNTIVLDPATSRSIPAVAVPVRVRDQIIGVIHVEAADARRRWTENEVSLVEAVAERAALALENASLFETAERRAEQERVLADVSARIGESNDIDRILQTTIQELGRALGAARTFIQLEAPNADESAARRVQASEPRG